MISNSFRKTVNSSRVSSVRELPIPDVVFEAILKERKQYEANRRRRTTTFQDLDYICCSTYGRPRSKNYHWQHYKKLLADNGLPDIRWHDLRSTYCTLNIPDEIPSAVRRYGNHFLASLLCIPKYNFYENISKGCYAPQMRQGLD